MRCDEIPLPFLLSTDCRAFKISLGDTFFRRSQSTSSPLRNKSNCELSLEYTSLDDITHLTFCGEGFDFTQWGPFTMTSQQ